MLRKWNLTAAVGAVAIVAVMAFGTVSAQTDEVSPQPGEAADAGLVVEVVGVDYHYQNLPTSLPVGASIAFRNGGTEFHEIAVARIADGVTESIEELMAMGEAAITAGKVEVIGALSAPPGTSAEGTLTLPREGRYVALCFIPQGMVPSRLQELGVTEDMAPEDWPPEAQAIMSNPPHAALGMLQEFTVTPAGTEIGPLPASVPTEATPEMSPAADA